MPSNCGGLGGLTFDTSFSCGATHFGPSGACRLRIGFAGFSGVNGGVSGECGAGVVTSSSGLTSTQSQIIIIMGQFLWYDGPKIYGPNHDTSHQKSAWTAY